MKPFLRSGFNYDTDVVSRETGLICDDISLTVQADSVDADINTIVARFGLTGQMPTNVSIPLSGDFTEIGDYHEAQNLLIQARDGFMQLPAEVRKRFGHDPSELVSFVSDPANREEAAALGIISLPPTSSAALPQEPVPAAPVVPAP